MKKLFALFLTFIMIFSLSACGKDKDKSNTATIDLEYYANLGQIPECAYKLGANVDEMKAKFEAEDKIAIENNEDYVFSETKGEKTVKLDNGEYLYYYEKSKKDNGVSYIVSFGTAYGLPIGTTILDTKKALTGYDYTEEAANDNNTFFLFGFSDGEVLKYTFDNTVIIFVFQESSLCATAIYNTDNWTI